MKGLRAWTQALVASSLTTRARSVGQHPRCSAAATANRLAALISDGDGVNDSLIILDPYPAWRPPNHKQEWPDRSRRALPLHQ